MASRTNNLGLIKPDLDDNIDVTQLNANSDILDNKVQQNSDNIVIVRNDLTAEINKRLPLTGGTLTGDLTAPNITINNDLTFNGDNTHQIITPSNTIELGDSIRFVQGNTYREFQKSGQNIINADYMRNAVYKGDTVKNYFEVNQDGNCYVGGNGVLQSTQQELQLKSKGGTNFAINDNGELYVNGSNIMRDVFTYGAEEHYKYTIYKISLYTVILQMRIYSSYGIGGGYRSEWVTFPIPFKNADYAISTTTTNNSASAVTGYNDNTCGGLTSTGCYVTMIHNTDTELLIIGRVN